jgi:hypothetical protein
MRKTIISLVLLSLTAIGVVPAAAQGDNAIVIIDSGFSTADISDNVVQEVCVTSNSGCNNGTGIQVGPGAAGTSIQIAPRFRSDWGHGTNMAKEAIKENPNVKIILLRNSRVFPSGNVLFGGEASLELSLKWVSDNASQYNISAVAMSRGSHTHLIANSSVRSHVINSEIYSRQLDKMGNATIFRASIAKFNRMLSDNRRSLSLLPDIACPASNTVKSLVVELATKNVATLFATGNDFNNRFVDTPACIDEAISVTASDSSGAVLLRSNVAPNTDFSVHANNTSIATAKLASKWSLMYNGSYNSTYEAISNSGSNSRSWSTIFVP